MSFLLDPPLLVASGAVAQAVAGDDDPLAGALYPLWFELGRALVRR